MNEELKYSVYVDDKKVNEEYLSEAAAEETALQYTNAGFKNVLIVDESTAEDIKEN